MAAILEGNTLTLTGFVGDNFWDDGFTHGDIVLALAQIDDAAELTVFLNSGGGYATEGAAIHALLSRRTGVTDIVVDGIAASAASLIAMAGDTVSMSMGAVMMIHDPAQITWGNSDDHAKTIEELEALATSYARVYAAKSGKSAEDCRTIMKTTRWLTADEAVTEGFADEALQEKASAVAAFDYRAYAHAPKHLVAMARAQNWSLDAAKQPKASAQASTRQQKENPAMTDKTKAETETADIEKEKATAAADAVKADRERRAAIMALDEAKGREALAEHLYATTEMSADEIKATLAAAPAATAPAPAGEGKPQASLANRANQPDSLGAAGITGEPEKKPKASINTTEIYAARRKAG